MDDTVNGKQGGRQDDCRHSEDAAIHLTAGMAGGYPCRFFMRKNDVIAFFARLAPNWDERSKKNSKIVDVILDNAGVSQEKAVLDVACGTGILIPDYLKRGVSSVTAIDITPEMTQIARDKYPQDNVTVICGDAAEIDYGKKFDCIVVYNALPHFPDPSLLIYRLASSLKPGGILTVAHGLSRNAINSVHTGAEHVSNGLMPAEKLAEVFGRYLTVTAVIDDDQMYQVAGKLERDLTGIQPPEAITGEQMCFEKENTMHEHEHEHMHEHMHEHHHDHGHTHEDITAFESTEQAVRILGYMLDHNRSHAEELHEICHRLEASGKETAAEYLDKAVDAFRDGNELMDKALRALNGEEE